MRLQWRLLSLGLFSLLFSMSSCAQLQIQLTQGVDAAMPLAIYPFSGDDVTLPGGVTMSQVVMTDLKNSGQFHDISPKKTVPLPTQSSDLDSKYLKKRGANVVLMGSVHAMPTGQYQVSIQLVDLYHQSSVDGAPHVLLQQRYTVSQSSLRRLAHKISDDVYEQLLGVPGVFSTKIAYVLVNHSGLSSARYQLMVADADGFNPQPLLTSLMPIMSPTWVDANHMVYVSFEGHRATIYWQDLVSGKRRVLSRSPGVNGAPAVSPDGKKLALVLTKTGNPNIYVMDIASGALQRITSGLSIDTEPAWSPDGKRLIFTSNRGGNPQVYQYRFSDKQIQRLTFDGNYNARASFLPNTSDIVMMHRDEGVFGIARQSLSSGRTEILTQSGSDESPSVSPNGKMVIYAMQYQGKGVLAVVSSDGRVKLRLPAQAGSVQEPAWSPYLG